MQFFGAFFFEFSPSVEVRKRSAKVLSKKGSRVVDDSESDVFLVKLKVGINGIIRSSRSSDASILTD